ncbi:MAG: TIGR04168 family protein [Gomphosphaeria aponina SAG 52.96 = DSM 107014]|uniref:TIGR04168 family protein n=1 Tax=Gomphosphaeria aponina SAG 52.96 = DSM 107014 TaxID=1521640 RepID=A0A941JUN3_9CHRO|nr:TIGR04168 family protein [Gomphosphaeria aponina SAG 52.96 = DSM 107014]
MREQLKIAVVGDIHDQWEMEDHVALQHLGVDLVLFVGDFGNESVEVVRKIASLAIPKAAIMGNHDGWYTASAWGRKKAPYDQSKEDRVQQQLDLLGQAHVGYGQLDLAELGISIVGSRPFSWGGPEWKNKEFFRDRFGVNNFASSTTRIVAAAQQSLHETIIFLGHNGPYGLGDKREDICGRDWKIEGGDYGDPDLSQAIAQVRAAGKKIPLVTFGHMHHRLRHTKERLRTVVNQDREGTIYYNCASVPRILEENGEKLRNFSLISLEKGIVTSISLVWLGEDVRMKSEKILYQGQKAMI